MPAGFTVDELGAGTGERSLFCCLVTFAELFFLLILDFSSLVQSGFTSFIYCRSFLGV